MRRVCSFCVRWCPQPCSVLGVLSWAETAQSSGTAPSKGFVLLHVALWSATKYFYSFLLPSCLHLIKSSTKLVNPLVGCVLMLSGTSEQKALPVLSCFSWGLQHDSNDSYMRVQTISCYLISSGWIAAWNCCLFTSRLNLPNSLLICFFFSVLLPSNFAKLDKQ